MPSRDLRFRALMDVDDLQRKLGSIERSTQDTSTRLQGAGQMARRAFAVVASGAALQFGKELFELGAQVEGWKNRAGTVFGDYIGIVEDWAAQVHDRFGVAEERMLDLSAGVGDLLVPLGLTRDAAADQTIKVLEMANALSEWTGGSIGAQEAAQILSKAMLGERDALIQLGIKIDENTVKTALAERGLSDLTGEEERRARALVTLDLIQEQSTDAMTAYADGSNEGLIAQRELEAAMDDLKIVASELVVELAPLVEILAEVARTSTAAFEGAADPDWLRDFGRNIDTAEGLLKDYVDTTIGGFADIQREGEEQAEATFNPWGQLAADEMRNVEMLMRQGGSSSMAAFSEAHLAEAAKLREDIRREGERARDAWAEGFLSGADRWADELLQGYYNSVKWELLTEYWRRAGLEGRMAYNSAFAEGGGPATGGGGTYVPGVDGPPLPGSTATEVERALERTARRGGTSRVIG